MKKLITLATLILAATSVFAQLTVNRTVTPATGPYRVGDTLTVRYNINRGATTPRYFWLRYQYNNKALLPLAGTTAFTQGNQVQTYNTEWNNYKFTPNATKAATSLYEQYQLTPWNYAVNGDWNVGQLSIQRADASLNGDFATQKFIIKDNTDYTNIHQLSLSYSNDAAGAFIAPITTSGDAVSLGNVTGGSSLFKVKVAFPNGYPITDHNVQLMRLKNDGSGDIDWSLQPLYTAPLDAAGEATFTQLKIGDSVGVFVGASFQKAWMNNVITVSDAYKAFLGHSQTDISGNPTYFTYPTFERKVGNVTKNDNVFNESDSYSLFAHVMGQDVSATAFIPTSTATQVRWYSGLLNQSWLDGTPKYRVLVTANNQTANAVFAWGGDLNWSHSTDPAVIAQNIQNGIVTNSANRNVTASFGNITTEASQMVGLYQAKANEQATLGVSSKLENGKVVLTTTLTKEGLAGLEVIMNYDNSKLTLDNVVFDAGSTITNFSTHDNGRLTFGSIDQLKTARIKTGTPYKLIFTPKVSLTNTAGLFYFVLSDAVDAAGNKIDLIID